MFVRLARRTAAAAGLAAVVLLLSSCGLQPATSYVPAVGPGSIKRIEGLGKADITVTSKNFTEQLVLGKIAVLATKAAGFHVTDLTNVPGSQPARDLLLSGEADIGWEYTGTAWLTYLGKKAGIADKAKQWQAVHDADLKNGITWGKPAPMNNTYAMAVRSEAVDKLGGISKLSDIAKLPVKDRTFCIESEFNSRPDGFNPMLEKYGLKRGAAKGVPEDNIGIYDTGAVYSATDNGACNFGEVFATDGRIKALDLTILKDDKNFFPAYNVGPEFYTETLQKYPQLTDIFAQITPKLTDDVLQSLNYKVDVAGEEPADVAFNWMLDEGLISKPQ
ncbi:glycine betaine ABC transporter substrate-binding protein [Paenarthrobacter sp. Z7-10]|uniref:glycine betaine ABC transporter substrate-binding protein n=1 Tax=Paenarthrobacter sp. Z7-10 TaxID=2787635 RepID=UPI0022A8EEE4|nr:glycine betaine ABC transporter substrate-binding protein [Paenarthrobacter sp. Z7-10]MCZ2403630.1 glycine betaine ABC transporter substrate-binding protein [Paenarthrobacter sp. Z7-10]